MFFKKIVERVKGLFTKTNSLDQAFRRGMDMSTLFNAVVIKPYQEISSCYKAVKAICDNVPQAEFGLYRDDTNEEIPDDDVIRLLRNPNPTQSGNDFIQEWVGFYALKGEGFIRLVRSMGQVAGTSRLPAQMYVLNPDHMQEVVDRQTGLLTGWKYGQIVLTPEEVLHVKDFNPYNQYRGLSPLEAIRNEMLVDKSTVEFNKRFFDNSAVPEYVLSTDKTLTEPQRKQLIQWVEQRHKGVKNSFKMGVLEGGLKAETLGSTHKDMDFIEQKRWSREEILGIWRSPKALFNITEDLNYATFVGQMKIFWIYTLMPIMRKFEDGINAKLVKPYNNKVHFGFNLQNVSAFQEDFKEKVATAQQLFAMGVPLNEINEKLNLGFSELPWGDDWWIGFGQVTARTAMETEQNPPDHTPAPAAPAPGDNNADDQGKSFKINPKNAMVWKRFVNLQGPIEKKMQGKLGKYLIELRGKVLSTPDAKLLKHETNVNWIDQAEAFKKTARPYIELGVNSGIDIAKEQVKTKSFKKDINDDIFQQKINSYVAGRVNKLTRVHDNIKKKIDLAIDNAIKDGQSIQGMSEELLASNIRDSLKGVFNSLSTRTMLIARTETASAVNGGSSIYYHEVGVEKKRWITAHDEFVRESHRQCENEGAIAMKDKFANGLEYPADMDNGDAGEVANCRCVLQPVITE